MHTARTIGSGCRGYKAFDAYDGYEGVIGRPRPQRGKVGSQTVQNPVNFGEKGLFGVKQYAVNSVLYKTFCKDGFKLGAYAINALYMRKIVKCHGRISVYAGDI